jgi:gas vesicle protein
MKNGMMKGLITGAVIGGSAAMMYGIANWQSARRMNQQVKKTGSWIASRTGDIVSKL